MRRLIEVPPLLSFARQQPLVNKFRRQMKLPGNAGSPAIPTKVSGLAALLGNQLDSVIRLKIKEPILTAPQGPILLLFFHY